MCLRLQKHGYISRMNLSFSIYMPELVAIGSPMKVFQNNSGPHWLSGYGL